MEDFLAISEAAQMTNLTRYSSMLLLTFRPNQHFWKTGKSDPDQYVSLTTATIFKKVKWSPSNVTHCVDGLVL